MIAQTKLAIVIAGLSLAIAPPFARAGQPSETAAAIDMSKNIDSMCGLRCVVVLLELNDINTNLSMLIEQSASTWRGREFVGFSAAEMGDILAEHGLTSKGFLFRTSNDLKQATPCIVHLNRDQDIPGHFVVALKVDESGVTVLDGLKGVKTYTSEQFDRTHTGHALVPIKQIQAIENNIVLWRRAKYGLAVAIVLAIGVIFFQQRKGAVS